MDWSEHFKTETIQNNIEFSGNGGLATTWRKNKMLCTEWPCKFESEHWRVMRIHYEVNHPEVKRPDKYYTKESSLKAKVHTKGKIKKSKQKTKEVRSQKKIATVRKRR